MKQLPVYVYYYYYYLLQVIYKAKQPVTPDQQVKSTSRLIHTLLDEYWSINFLKSSTDAAHTTSWGKLFHGSILLGVIDS